MNVCQNSKSQNSHIVVFQKQVHNYEHPLYWYIKSLRFSKNTPMIFNLTFWPVEYFLFLQAMWNVVPNYLLLLYITLGTIYIRYLLRFFDCLAHPNLSATFATDQKWPLCHLHISYQSLAGGLRSLQKSEFLKLIILIFHVKKLNN